MSTQIWSYSPRLDWSQLIDCCCCCCCCSYRSSQSQVWQQILLFDATNQCSCLFIWTFNCYAASNVQVDGVRCFVNRWLSHALGRLQPSIINSGNVLCTICCQSQCLEMFSFFDIQKYSDDLLGQPLITNSVWTPMFNFEHFSQYFNSYAECKAF